MRTRRRAAGAAGLVALAVGAGVLGPALLGGAPDSTLTQARQGSPAAASTATREPTWELHTVTPPAQNPLSVLATLRRRPVLLPTLAAGASCPVSPTRRLPAAGGFTGPFTAVGPGPVYLAGGPPFTFEFPPAAGAEWADKGWSAQKVYWVLSATYAGPVLIRGRRLDGPQPLAFDYGQRAYGPAVQGGGPFPEVDYLDVTESIVLQVYPSALALRSPGCYGVQVDGTTAAGDPVRETIIFRAVAAKP